MRRLGPRISPSVERTAGITQLGGASAIPPGHVTAVAERTVANAVLMHAESLLGFGAPQWRDFRISAIVIRVVCIPIDDSCKILL